jgi:hypothetical protein
MFDGRAAWLEPGAVLDAAGLVDEEVVDVAALAIAAPPAAAAPIAAPVTSIDLMFRMSLLREGFDRVRSIVPAPRQKTTRLT